MSKKIYTIEVTDNGDSGCTISRTNDGFNYMELLGILEHTQLDLIHRLQNDINPDKIKTKVILTKENK